MTITPLEDEIKIQMYTALGIVLIEGIMPKKMKEGLIKTYLESGTVKSTYLHINDKEITDGKDHNPLHKPIKRHVETDEEYAKRIPLED